MISQVALTTLLTAGGAAILHRAFTLQAIDLGFEPTGVSTTSTVLPHNRYPSVEARWNAWLSILDGLAAQGLTAAAAFNTPMSGAEMPPIGIRADAASEEVFSEFHYVSPDYFSVMGIELLAGRTFTPDDRVTSTRVAIVSETFVERYFSGGTSLAEVIGRQIGPSSEAVVVVGVVESTRHEGPDTPEMPDLYVPLSQSSLPAASLLVRAEPSRAAEAISVVAARVDASLRWTPTMPYRSYLAEWFAPLRLQLVLIGVLCALGLLLASLGLYFLMAYQVASRRKEIAVRKAVGATEGSLMGEVVLRGAGMTVAGAAVGLCAWYVLIPRTRQLVDGIDPTNNLIPVAVGLVVGGASLVATLVPAIRAARTDPAMALKE